jgi:hypothetical protein
MVRLPADTPDGNAQLCMGKGAIDLVAPRVDPEWSSGSIDFGADEVKARGG